MSHLVELTFLSKHAVFLASQELPTTRSFLDEGALEAIGGDLSVRGAGATLASPSVLEAI